MQWCHQQHAFGCTQVVVVLAQPAPSLISYNPPTNSHNWLDCWPLQVTLTAAATSKNSSSITIKSAAGGNAGANMIQTIFSDYAPNTFPTTEVRLVATISSARKLRACETRCMSEGMCWSCLQALYRVQHVCDMCGDALHQLLWAGLSSEWLLHSLESF